MRTNRIVAILALLFGVSGCRESTAPENVLRLEDPGPLPALQEPPAPVLVGDLLFESSARLLGDAATPPRLALGVTARNTAAAAASLDEVCVLQIRAFQSQSEAPAWRSPGELSTSCPSATAAREIPAGAEFSVRAAETLDYPLVRDILGDSLPDGQYAFGALVRVGADTVAVPAGHLMLSADPRPPLQDPARLTYSAALGVEGLAPGHLVTRVTAANQGDRTVYLEFGACSLRLRAYRTPELTGRPVWRSEYRQRPGSSYGYACPGYLATRLIPPGEVISPPEFNLAIPLHEVLGDSLPDGHYYFTAVLVFQRGGGTTLRHDSVSIRAGGAELSSAVDPLPQEREVGGVLYRAETAPEAAAPGTLRLALTVTNPGTERVLILDSRSTTCAAQLLGFAAAEQRDRWYLAEGAQWAAAGCPLRIPPTWLGPGESQTFASNVGGTTMGGLDPAQLYRALVLWTEQEPGSSHRIVLAAGDPVQGE